MKSIHTQLFAILILLFTTVSKAQSSGDDIFHIDLRKNILTENGTMAFYTTKDKSSIETINPKVEYFWFADARLHSTFGGISGEPLNGEFNSYYKSGNLRENGLFNLGLKNGKWTIWYETGNIKSTYSWENGILSGSFEEYDSDGSVIKKGAYVNNLLSGKVITYKKGHLTKEERFKSGILKKTRQFGFLKSDSTFH